jgi:hypothetical protein
MVCCHLAMVEQLRGWQCEAFTQGSVVARAPVLVALCSCMGVKMPVSIGMQRSTCSIIAGQAARCSTLLPGRHSVVCETGFVCCMLPGMVVVSAALVWTVCALPWQPICLGQQWV